jgi:hypothetical protein
MITAAILHRWRFVSAAESQHGKHAMTDRPLRIEKRRRSLRDPQYWRDRAGEDRTHAGQVQDLEMKALWLRIAQGHERQATLLERLHELADRRTGR